MNQAFTQYKKAGKILIINTIHPKKHKCTLCGQIFALKRSVRNHLKMKHNFSKEDIMKIEIPRLQPDPADLSIACRPGKFLNL